MPRLSRRQLKMSLPDIDHIPSEVELSPLSENERVLLYMIRYRYRFGNITIETRDGVPMYLTQTVQREKLGTT